MADGDEIHTNLPRRYLNAYRDVCAPTFDAEDVAHGVAQVVLKDARGYGNGPVQFIANCVESLANQLPEEPLLRQTVNYGSVQQQIEQMARQYHGSETGMELAKRFVRRAVEIYREGGSFADVQGAVQGYLTNIHEARFADCVPMTSEHLNSISSERVNRRLDEMRPFSQLEYAHLSRSIVRQGGVKGRIHRRRFDNGLGLYDEVL